MKKCLVLGFLAAAALVSCSKEAFRDDSSNIVKDGNYTVFNAGFADTKTYLDGSLTPLWSDSDKLVVNGVVSTDESVSLDRQRMSFKVEGVSSPYCVLSPASLYDTKLGSKFDSDTIVAVVPGTQRMQQYVPGSYSPEGAIAAAYTTTTSSIQMESLSVFFKITVSGGTDSENISKILIHQGDGSGVAGLWNVIYSEESIDLEPRSLTSPVGYYCGDGGLAQGTTVLVGIPAYNYANGLIVSIQDVSDHFCNYTIDASNADFLGMGGHIIPLNAALSPKTFNVGTEAEWNAMAKQLNCVYEKANCAINISNNISATNLDKINKTFSGTLNGGGKTLTRSAGTGPLIRGIEGSVSNLTLAGAIAGNEVQYSSLADSLRAHGSISGVVSSVGYTINTIYDNSRGYNYVALGGIVRILAGGSMTNCSNSGNISVTTDVSAGKMHVEVGGIAAQVAFELKAGSGLGDAGDVTLTNCDNSGTITLDPIGSNKDYGYTDNAVGGIVGWLRCANNSVVIDGCDNSGAIEYMGTHITNEKDLYAYACCVGGIVGIGSPVYSGVNANVIKGTAEKGINVEIKNCNNTAQIHNCFTNYATSNPTSSCNKVYTGGIAGSLVGKPANMAKLTNCKNTGTILPYDINQSVRPAYCAVAGGLIGIGGLVTIDNCKLSCTIGNGNRPTTAIAGAIGYVIQKFELKNSTIWYEGYWTRISEYRDNRASVAVCQKKYGTSTTLSYAPEVAGSVISDCTIGAKLHTSTSCCAAAATNQSGNLTTSLNFNTQDNLVKGQGYAFSTSDVSVSNITYITSAPSL